MELDYDEIGLRCGIEIHQQLDTDKLFCSCPSILRDDEPDIVVRRRMRVVAGEIGEIDPAALHEFLRKRELIYEAYSDTNCLVELDEEPPHKINMDALETAMKVALMLNARIVDQLQIMRKTVIDGSNTSGFQRTALIAMDGFIEIGNSRIGIPTICIEEDSARRIREEGNGIVYRVDRLGIPLIEIATSSEIKNPEQAREVAEKIGTILRTVGRVKRGIGTIRQDLNISISKGERIEVKGVQDLRLIPKVIKFEVNRQIMLIAIREELRRRGIKKSDIKEEFIDIGDVFKNTKSKLVSNSLKRGLMAMSLILRGFGGLLRDRLGPEIAQYVRAKSNAKGIIHSDELPGYGISDGEKKEIMRKLNLSSMDAFVIVFGDRETCEDALKIVVERCRMAIDGVPKETRRAKEDGTTEYMRPLPGSARMYPETDEMPITITKEMIDRLKRELPMLPDEKLRILEEMGISKELGNQLIRSKFINTFEEFVNEFRNIKPTLIATTLLLTPKEIRKRFNVNTENLKKNHYREVLRFVNDKIISKEVIPDILAELARNPEGDVKSIIEDRNLTLMSRDEVEKVIDRIMEETRDMEFGVLMGRAMAELRGRSDVEIVKEIIREKLKER